MLLIPIIEEFGWNRADVSGAIALMFVTLASVTPFSGALMLRYGLARVVTASAVLVVAGLLATTLVTQKWHLLLSVGILLGLASGVGAWASPPPSAAAGSWPVTVSRSAS